MCYLFICNWNTYFVQFLPNFDGFFFMILRRLYRAVAKPREVVRSVEDFVRKK